MATLIKTDGRRLEIAPLNRRSFHLSELQRIVGGYIEAVYLPDGRVMFVNEDGKRDALALNHEATRITAGLLQPGDYIVGDAVIVTREEAGEDEDGEEDE